MYPLLALAGLKAGSSLLGSLMNNINSGINAHLNRQQQWEMFQQSQAQQLLMQDKNIQNQLQMQQNSIQNQLQMQQNAFNQQNYLASNAVQLKMQDLEKAGINPLLASSSNAFSTGGSGSNVVNNQTTNKGNQPSNGQYPKVVNAKKLYILK